MFLSEKNTLWWNREIGFWILLVESFRKCVICHIIALILLITRKTYNYVNVCICTCFWSWNTPLIKSRDWFLNSTRWELWKMCYFSYFDKNWLIIWGKVHISCTCTIVHVFDPVTGRISDIPVSKILLRVYPYSVGLPNIMSLS